MPGVPIQPTVLTEIQRQFNHELSAAHAYTALATWCAERNLKGFSNFFHKQAGEEREHAQRFMDHLLDRGAMPELAAIPAPKTSFKSLLEAVQHARTMEQVNTAGIHQAYEAALAHKDYPAQVALQWFITEQVEEEAWCDELVARVEAANCAGGMTSLDRHLEKILSAKAHDGGHED
jgi:ferritin